MRCSLCLSLTLPLWPVLTLLFLCVRHCVGCAGSRAWVRAGGSVTFNAPDGGYTIRAVHAAQHGPVSVAEMTIGGSGRVSSCPEDINQDLTVDVNDLLSMLSGFGGSGADGSDVNGDSLVDVNDLLQLLSAFGSPCTGGGLIPLPPVEEPCSGCCPVGAACFAPDPPCCADRAPTCTQGADCGGQVWNDCGTSCPLVCGNPPPQMCNMMCNSAFQCTSRAPWWDNNAGQCVTEAECSDVFVLPPGMAIGRPFLTVQETPSTAVPLEALSDWMIEL